MLEINNLTVSYVKGSYIYKAINEVSFFLKKGMILGIVGESGAGKSTIVNSIMQILPLSSLFKGSVVFEGTHINKKTICGIRGKKISYISQNFHQSLSHYFKIKTQFDMLLKSNLELTERQRYLKMFNILESLNFSNPKSVLESYPFELSSGMMQRVVIAMAISTEPDLLIADEPTSAIDVIVIKEFLDYLKVLNKSKNISILIVSHDLNIIKGFCDEVNVLLGGHIVESNMAAKIFYEPCHPYTELLINSRPCNKKKALQEKKKIRENTNSPCPFYCYCDKAALECKDELYEKKKRNDVVKCNIFKNDYDSRKVV